MAVVVVVAHGRAEAVSTRDPRDPRGVRRVLERPVPLVAEQAIADRGADIKRSELSGTGILPVAFRGTGILPVAFTHGLEGRAT